MTLSDALATLGFFGLLAAIMMIDSRLRSK